MSSTSGSPSPPPPSGTLVLRLPPGMTPNQFLSLQGSAVTIAITIAVAFGILLWDHLNLLPDEIELYRSPKLWRSPPAWAFVVLRYSGILATFAALFFTSIQTNHCQLAVSLSSACAVLVVAASGLIFTYRTFAIWNGDKLIYGVIGFFYVVMLGCWIADATQYKALNGPSTPFGSNCQMQPIVGWAPISYSSSVAFDTIVVILSLFKLNANRLQKRSKIGFLVYRDNLLYFIFTAITNITVLVIQAQGHSLDLVKPTAVPFSTLITTTMGARVFLNLKLFDQRKARENQNSSLPLSSTSTGSRNYGGDYVKPAVPAVPMTILPKSEKQEVGNYEYGIDSKAILAMYEQPKGLLSVFPPNPQQYSAEQDPPHQNRDDQLQIRRDTVINIE